MQSEFECVPWDGGKQTALISITNQTTHELKSSTTLVLPTCSDMPPPPCFDNVPRSVTIVQHSCAPSPPTLMTVGAPLFRGTSGSADPHLHAPPSG